jgi:hypothetical protein
MANPTTQTFVKDTAPTPPVRRVLTVYERESLKQAANVYGAGQVASENFSNGAMGASPTNVPWMRTNRVRLNEQQRNVMKVLEDGTPEPTNPDERDKLARRSTALLEQFKPFIQTRREIRSHSHRDPDFMSALKKAGDWTKPQKELGGRSPQEVEEEYKNICRRLDPENPDAGNIEEFRPK